MGVAVAPDFRLGFGDRCCVPDALRLVVPACGFRVSGVPFGLHDGLVPGMLGGGVLGAP